MRKGKHIYLNYKKGNDHNDGSSPEKAVKTRKRARELIILPEEPITKPSYCYGYGVGDFFDSLLS